MNFFPWDIKNKFIVNLKLILQIHDELVFDVPREEVEIVKKLAQDAMQNVVQLKVPLTVSVSISKTLNK